MNHQQDLIVGVSGRWAPIEGSRDHRFVIDDGELVMQLVAAREARGANALQALIEGEVASFHLAGAIRKADPQ